MGGPVPQLHRKTWLREFPDSHDVVASQKPGQDEDRDPLLQQIWPHAQDGCHRVREVRCSCRKHRTTRHGTYRHPLFRLCHLRGRVDWRVKKFIKTLTPDKVGRVICFSSAAIIDSNYPKVKALFEKQGIPVDERQFTCRGSMGPIHAGHPDKADHEALAAFIESTI